MKQLLSAVRRAPMLKGLAAVLAGVAIVPAALLAWGPDRPTFTMQSPAPYVTFNSITDNPKHGDERNFVQIRNYTDNGEFGENTDLIPGKEYEVYVYYHNNASPDLNDAEDDYKGVAENAYMKVQMPATVASGDKARVGGTVGASNAKPTSVWDEAYGQNDTNGTVALRYVQNSATLTSAGAVNGTKLDLNQLASENGAKLGYDALDGKLPGCLEYAGYVKYRFVVDQPNFSVDKQVSLDGSNQFTESVEAEAGDTVNFRIHYKNTGTMTQTNVSIRDDLPEDMTLVEGSAKYFNSKTNGAWKTIEDADAITTSGVDFGAFAANAGMYVTLKATVADEADLECGTNTLTNRAVVTTPNGTKNDTAQVTVTKECEEPEPEMVKVCDLKDMTVKEITEDEYNDNRDRYTKDLSKCDKEPEPEMVEVCDLDDMTVKQVTREELEANPERYTEDLTQCDDVTVCDPETGEIITVKKSEEDDYLPVDAEECKVEVCDPETGNVITVPKEDEDKYLPVDAEDCKDEPVETEVPVCDPDTGEIITVKESEASEYLDKDAEECQDKEEPEVKGEVTELPKTGLGQTLSGVFGLGAVTTAGYYYLASRRN